MMFEREHDFDAEIDAARRAVGRIVPVAIVKAIIAAESGFDPQAIRPEPSLRDASRGLMQVLYGTARRLGYRGPPEGLFEPAVNILYGVKLLAQLYQQLQDWPRVFSAYNGGLRPELGFGAPLTRSTRVCLARDARGQCVKWRTARPGEFANQDYVNRVRELLQYFGKGRAAVPVTAAFWLVPLVGLAFLAQRG